VATIEKQEACQLYIEQEIEAGLADGKTKYAIGQEIAGWIEKLFGAKVKPDTIKKRAQRYETKLVTNVTTDTSDTIGTNVPNLDTLTPTQQQIIEIYEKNKQSEKLKKREVLQEKQDAIKEQSKQALKTQPLLYQATCLDWLKGQPQCDLLLTDPPYMTDVEDIYKFAEWLPYALAKVKATGRAYVCIGAYPDEIEAYLKTQKASDKTLANILVWTYRNTLGPSPKYDYKLNWQAILYFRGIDAPPLDCPLMNEQFSVQDINAPDGRLGNRFHTWQKPDELAERLIRHSTKEGDLVYDCFAGTGTFLLTANRLGRIGSGCENDSKMLRIAQERGCKIS